MEAKRTSKKNFQTAVPIVCYYNLIKAHKIEIVTCYACAVDIFNDEETILEHVESLDHLQKLVRSLQKMVRDRAPVPAQILHQRYLMLHGMVLYNVYNIYCETCLDKIKIPRESDELDLLMKTADEHIKRSPPHMDYLLNFIHRAYVPFPVNSASSSADSSERNSPPVPDQIDYVRIPRYCDMSLSSINSSEHSFASCTSDDGIEKYSLSSLRRHLINRIERAGLPFIPYNNVEDNAELNVRPTNESDSREEESGSAEENVNNQNSDSDGELDPVQGESSKETNS